MIGEAVELALTLSFLSISMAFMHSYKTNQRYYCLFLLLTIRHWCAAQTFADTVIMSNDNDSVKVTRLYNWFVEHSKAGRPDELTNAERTYAFARTLTQSGQRSKLYAATAASFYHLEKFDKAQVAISASLVEAKIAKDPNQTAVAYRGLTRLYHSTKDQVRCTESLVQLDSILPHVTDPLIEANCLTFLCNIYGARNRFDLVELYARKADQITKKYDIKMIRPSVIYHLGKVFESRSELDSAIWYLKSAREGYQVINNREEEAGMTMQLAQLYAKKGEPLKAQREMEYAVAQVEKSADTMGIAYVSMEQGRLLKQLGISGAAETAFKRSEVLMDKMGLPAYQKQLFLTMAAFYESENRFDEALRYFKKSTVLRDSFENIETLKKVEELEARYETRKKEATISQLNQENHNKNLQLGLLGTMSILLLVAAWAGYVWVRSRQRKELMEKQKQWSKAVVESTDMERRRIASDLHDGIAQQLATIKMLSAGLIDYTTTAAAPKLQTLRSEIEATSKEVRQLAHRMIPRNLDTQGLLEALDDLLFMQFQDTGITTALQIENYKAAADQDFDTALYRIAQEAINNIVKHAKATEVELRLESDETGRITMLIADNGLGMPGVSPGMYSIEQLPARKTLGLRSMESRAGLVGGQVQFELPEQGGMRIWVRLNNHAHDTNSHSRR
jgi:signal transduction histidine kinase